MGLEDRIEEEMVVDSESLLEEEFDRAAKVFKILDSGSIELRPGYRDLSPKERMLAYLVGQVYAVEGNRTNSPVLPYDFFYTRIDLDDSTIRRHANELEDDGLLTTGESQGEKKLVVENLPRVLDRIEAEAE